MRRRNLILFIVGLLLAVPLCAAAQQEQLVIEGPGQGARISYQTMEDGRLLVSVTNEDETPVMGLSKADFSIRNSRKTAKIVSVEPLSTSKEIGLNIVMIIDNSVSMKMRKAVGPLKEALETFYKTIRPIDKVSVVVFDDHQTEMISGRALHVKKADDLNVAQLRAFVSDNLDNGLTAGTYLYDAMVYGLDLVGKMPEKSNKFMVVFSDGQDINSSVEPADVEAAANGLPNFAAYAVDYMQSDENDPFLSRFTADHKGRLWKAGSATELLPVFEAFSSTLLHRYVIAYRFLEAPTGSISFATPALTIEEITTIDSAPLLNYIFFDHGKAELPPRYKLLQSQNDTEAFSESSLKGSMEKYSHALNIIGKRMRETPEAKLTIIGCNANTGDEKGRKDLSLQRAEAVRAYLRYVWNIDSDRLGVEQRNLPAAPSSRSTPEGSVENQRAEIYSDHPAILDTVNSEYVQKVCDQQQLQLVPSISSEAGIADWTLTLNCGEQVLHTLKGRGDMPGRLSVPLEASLVEAFTTCDSLRGDIQAVDNENNVLEQNGSEILPINFLQRKEMMAQVQGYKVKEQYALILFDYDSTAIKERNQQIVDRIVQRMQQIPNAMASIVGHTDILGKEAYNLSLSRKRAEAVQGQIMATAPHLAQKLSVTGVGPHDPLYDNGLPEGRALNRTVTITLEYQQMQ